MDAEHFSRLALLVGVFSQHLVKDDRERRKRSIVAKTMMLNRNALLHRTIAKTVNGRKKRRVWSKHRNSCWWNNVLKKSNGREWVNFFGVDKELFNQICNMVRKDLKPKPTKLLAREPISVEKRVAIALHKFATSAEYRVIGSKMGVSKGSVHKSICLFMNAMLKHLRDVIKMPTAEEAEEISKKFENICQIPQILLIIDSTHVPILAPQSTHAHFVNSKGWASYNVQIVADVNCIIRDVSCSFPGATHDAQVFKNSGFFQHINDLLPKKTKLINGVDVNYLVLGHSAYPLLNWLLKNYTGNLDPLQQSFNAYMNSARIIVDQTIRILKNRWRILQKTNKMDNKLIPKVVIVCCMLHNLTRKKSPLADPVNVADADGHSFDLEQPNIQDMTRNFSSINSPGETVRNAIRSITDALPLRTI